MYTLIKLSKKQLNGVFVFNFIITNLVEIVLEHNGNKKYFLNKIFKIKLKLINVTTCKKKRY